MILSADKDDSCLFMGGRKPVYEGNDSGVEKAPFDGKNCNSNTSENKLGVKMELCGHTETSASSTLNSLMSEFHDVMLQSKDQLMQKMFTSLCKFSHKSTDLAHALFVALFPQIWASLKIDEQSTLCAELNAFLVSGAHLVQRDVPNSCIKTFLEALAQCTPTVMLRPTVLKVCNRWKHISFESSIKLGEQEAGFWIMFFQDCLVPKRIDWMKFTRNILSYNTSAKITLTS